MHFICFHLFDLDKKFHRGTLNQYAKQYDVDGESQTTKLQYLPTMIAIAREVVTRSIADHPSVSLSASDSDSRVSFQNVLRLP
jgi:hypothetical protein